MKLAKCDGWESIILKSIGVLLKKEKEKKRIHITRGLYYKKNLYNYTKFEGEKKKFIFIFTYCFMK